MAQIFRWSPAIRVKENGDKFGVFQLKCPAETKGAKRYTGETPMVKWDFWAVDCGKVGGNLVWIDKNFMEFNGKTKTSLTLAFKTIDGDIDIVSMPFDGFALRNVMNHLCGMGERVFSDVITLTYGVWKKKEDGKVVTGNDGSPIWNTSLNFEGVTPLYSLSKDIDHNYWKNPGNPKCTYQRLFAFFSRYVPTGICSMISSAVKNPLSLFSYPKEIICGSKLASN